MDGMTPCPRCDSTEYVRRIVDPELNASYRCVTCNHNFGPKVKSR